jgi:hypothetical protein
MLLDDERHDAAERRVEEALAEAEPDGEHDQQREGQRAGGVGHRERPDHRQPRRVRDQHQRPPRVPVGERPADQQRRQHREALREQDDRQRRLRPRQLERLPAERDDERSVADQRHRLAAPQEPEVPAPQRRQAADAPGGLGHRRHGPKLSSPG